jgi:hypothetical protein
VIKESSTNAENIKYMSLLCNILAAAALNTVTKNTISTATH